MNNTGSINNFNSNDTNKDCVVDYSIVIYYVNDNECEVNVRRIDELSWDVTFSIIITSFNNNYNSYKYEEVLVVPPSSTSCLQIQYHTNITIHKDTTIYKQQRIQKNIIQTFYSYNPHNEYHANAYKTFEEKVSSSLSLPSLSLHYHHYIIIIIAIIIIIIIKNPEYKMFFFLDNECRQLIKQFFPPRVLNAYDLLVPKAFRADLFRYCALYILGGCYVDHKIIARKSFRALINDHDDLLVTYDTGEFLGVKLRLFNGFMCSKRGDSRITKLIDDVVSNIEHQFHGYYFLSQSDLSITGPMVCSSFTTTTTSTTTTATTNTTTTTTTTTTNTTTTTTNTTNTTTTTTTTLLHSATLL